MSEIVQIIDTLEDNVQKLMQRIQELEEQNTNLSKIISKETTEAQQKSTQIEFLSKEIESLKISNSLLGSDEYKRETKLKINSLIREIDYCIAQLSD